jgi:hypothetical protein
MSKRKKLRITTPEFNSYCAQVAHRIPLHVRDQQDAAARELWSRVQCFSEDNGMRKYLLDVEDVSCGWRRVLDEFADWIERNRIRFCPHIQSDVVQFTMLNLTASHQLDAAAIFCRSCTTQLSKLIVADTIENNTCDGCRTYCRDGLYSSIMPLGSMLIGAGFCTACSGNNHM